MDVSIKVFFVKGNFVYRHTQGEAAANAGFKTERWAKVKEFWPEHVPNFEERGFKVGPSFFWLEVSVCNSDPKRRF